jgi:uncharacterized protein
LVHPRIRQRPWHQAAHRCHQHAQQAQASWISFERMVAADLRLLPVAPAHFHRAAELVLDAASALSVGDALHLACAEAAGAKYMASLDNALGRNAQRIKMKLVPLRGTA